MWKRRIHLSSLWGLDVYKRQDQMDMVEHANAITIHKSQGNECQVVIIPWVWAFYKMLKRNILYTGITRAKQKVYLVGEKKAITVAVSYTHLVGIDFRKCDFFSLNLVHDFFHSCELVF